MSAAKRIAKNTEILSLANSWRRNIAVIKMILLFILIIGEKT